MAAYLQVFDYVVIVAVILGSLGIGLFFGRKKQDSNEYTSGGGKLGLFPVSLSLTVSYMSAITVQGTPAEVYLYGPEFMALTLSFWGSIVAAYTFVPLYCRLDIRSVYEYLEIRFESRGPRIMGYALGIIGATFYMGIATFGPASALESVTGVPTWINILIILGICTVYTSVGGIKAVIWTDVFQCVIMVFGLLAIVFVGIFGLEDTTIWAELQKRERLTFHLSPDPTLRINIWILAIGKAFLWLHLFQAQPALMRYRSVGTESRAKKMIVLSSIGFILFTTLAGISGLVMYAYYSEKGCGPLANEDIYSPNQMVSFFIADAISIQGIPGLFIAALLSATFSSISSSQNAISAILWYDVIQPHVGHVNDATKTLAMKIIVLIFGGFSIAVAFLSKSMGGSLIQIAATLLSVIGGPSFGMFLVGGAFPFVGSMASMLGVVISTIVCSILALGKILYGSNWDDPILISEGCTSTFNNTLINGTVDEITTEYMQSEPVTAEYDFWLDLFSVSPFLYSVIGTVLTMLLAIAFSFIPSMRQSDVNKSTLYPILAKCLYPEDEKKYLPTNLHELTNVKTEKYLSTGKDSNGYTVVENKQDEDDVKNDPHAKECLLEK